MSVLAGKGFSYSIPSRASSNQMYIEALDRIVLKANMKERAFASTKEVRKTAIMTRVLELIHQVRRGARTRARGRPAAAPAMGRLLCADTPAGGGRQAGRGARACGTRQAALPAKHTEPHTLPHGSRTGPRRATGPAAAACARRRGASARTHARTHARLLTPCVHPHAARPTRRQVVGKGIHITKRDLFYTDVKLFTKQEESDAVLDDVACLVGCTRTSLNVVASDKVRATLAGAMPSDVIIHGNSKPRENQGEETVEPGDDRARMHRTAPHSTMHHSPCTMHHAPHV